MNKAFKSIFCLLIIFSCNTQEFVKNNIPKAEADYSHKYINFLKKGKIDSSYNMMIDSLKTDDTYQVLDFFSSTLQQSDSIEVVTFYTSTNNILYSSDADSSQNIKSTEIFYKAKLDTSWIIINVYLENRNNELLVSGIHLTPISEPFEEYISFSFKNAIFADYIFLTIAFIIPVLIIYTLFLLIRSDFKKKWLWFIFILFGFCNFYYYWEAHELTLKFFTFQFLGSGFIRPNLLSPHIIILSLPIGAITFLYIKSKKKKIQIRAKKLFRLD